MGNCLGPYILAPNALEKTCVALFGNGSSPWARTVKQRLGASLADHAAQADDLASEQPFIAHRLS